MNSQHALRIVIAGHVDHGKSTLIGRLFHDTGSLPIERYREIEATCRSLGRPFEFAYLLDALEEEREHGITIDTAQAFFRTELRPYVIIDAPGHKEFLKNMVTGASNAEAAILLVDVVEGVRDQTRRHAYVLSLLGLKQIVVAVNKVDRVGFGRPAFVGAAAEIQAFLESIGVPPVHVVPISAKEGDNVATRSTRMPWYEGPTLLEALDRLEAVGAPVDLPLRFPVQDVYLWDSKRIYAGRVETGSAWPGMGVTFWPSGKASVIRSIERWKESEIDSAQAGESIGITLQDEVFVERGEIMAPEEHPLTASSEIRASVFWLGKSPLFLNHRYLLKLATAEVPVKVVAIEEKLDSSTLERMRDNPERLETPEVATVVFAADRPIAADLHQVNPWLGRLVIVDEGRVAGGGIIRDLGSQSLRENPALEISLSDAER